jgi:hypothetical protein
MPEETIKQFPARYVVYWPGKTTYCCQEHTIRLLSLAEVMETPVDCAVHYGDEECKNCINEFKNFAKP